MFGGWIDFTVVVFVQLLTFLVVAYFQRARIVRVLGKGVVIGIPFGLLFDLVLGKYFGVNSYVLGFTFPFLLVNAALSYGLFTATILLLQRAKLPQLFAWTTGVTVVYEVANYFSPVWHWEFALPTAALWVAVLVGYLCGALVVIWINKLLFRSHSS